MGVNYWLIDGNYVLVYAHLGIIFLVGVYYHKYVKWQFIVYAAISMGIAWGIRNIGNKEHGLWHIFAGAALYFCTYSIYHTALLMNQMRRKRDIDQNTKQ